MKQSEIKMIKKVLEHFDSIPFSVSLSGEKLFQVGVGTPRFHLKVNAPISKKDLLTSTSLALGEAYMRKDIEIEGDLIAALSCAMEQLSHFRVDKRVLKGILYTSSKKANQKKEVSSHYDLGNDFYKLWLDQTLSYSCAYFRQPDDALYDAQIAKIDYCLKKLCLSPGMHLLDIGCGWGGLLIAAAKKYGIKGLGVTLSEEQCKEANARIKEEGLEDQIEVRIMDYRDLQKSGLAFDRIISIGMIEHVGRKNYGLYLESAKSVLKPGGVFLLHSITAKKETPGDPWIKTYIFPGGVVPSLRELIYNSYETGYLVKDVESLRLHYYHTLLHWFNNFQKCKEEVTQMKGEKFSRMWELYLGCCAASFHCGNIDLHQLVLTNGCNNDLPLTRDFLYQPSKEEDA